MLERLEQIEWSSLRHAYGDASDVPDLIRSLAAPDRKTREDALYELYGNIWHQGTVYEATAHAVPFLIELLRHPELPERHKVVVLLRELATGSSYHDVHGDLDWFREERNTPEFKEKVERELGWVKAAHEAVLDGLDLYLNLAEDEDDQVRTAIPFLLSICRCHEERIEPVLHRLATEDPCEQVRASALFGLLKIRQYRSAEREPSRAVVQLAPLFRQHMLNTGEAPLVRLVAAQCWLESTDSEDVSEALAVARKTIPLAGQEYQDHIWIQGDEPFSTFAGVLSRHRSAQIAWLKEGLRAEATVEDALWAIDEATRESRSFSWEIAPVLIEGLVNGSGKRRDQFAASLARVGESAIVPLENLVEGPDRKIRNVARETLETIRKRRDEYRLEHIFHFRRNWKKWQPTRLLTAQLQLHRHSKRQDVLWTVEPAIVELGKGGPRARAAIPILKKVLGHENQWMRGYAAWALWHIEGDPNTIWPVLTEELQCRPVGFIVLDCLASMGPLAAEAIPVLQRYIETDRRLPTAATTDTWNHMDDMFRAACEKTLATIRGE